MNKQFKIKNHLDTEAEIDKRLKKVVHEVELEGHKVPAGSKELLRKSMTGEISREEYRNIILARTENNFK